MPFCGASYPLPPLCPAYHHIDLPTTAVGTDQALAPFEDGGFGAVSSSHFGGVGLHLVAAFPAPYDQPHTGRAGSAQRHRRAGLGFHPRPFPGEDSDAGPIIVP
jgi:hypothetical protein